MAFLVVEKGKEHNIGQVFSLGTSSILIGRPTPGSRPDIILYGEYISRSHAKIKYEQGCYLICDLESRNGTTLDDKALEPSKFYRLKHGSIIGLGISSGKPCVLLRFNESDETVSINDSDMGKSTASEAYVRWLKIDKKRKEVWVDTKLISLSKKEYDLILLLYDKAGAVCSKDEIIEAVWSDVSDPGLISDATVDQLIHRLRNKVEIKKSDRIVSRKGFGYMLVP